MSGLDEDRRVVLRDHRRPKPMTQTLRQLRKMVKSAERSLERKMSTFVGGQFVLLVKALRQNRAGQVHEVVEIVGSSGLKGSLEAHLSDVLYDIPDDPTDKAPGCKDTHIDPDQDEPDPCGATAEPHVVEEEEIALLPDDLPVVPTDDMPPSCNVSPPQDSQDSILDIEGTVEDDDGEVSLMEWHADVTASKDLSAADISDHEEDADQSANNDQDMSGMWRSLIHPDDPFLSLIPCEIPTVASVLQQYQHNHLEAYRHLGYRISDALAQWFDCGDGHRMWNSVHSRHPQLLHPPLTTRSKSGMTLGSFRKRGSSTEFQKKNRYRGQVRASRARQKQAAKTKMLRDAVLYA